MKIACYALFPKPIMNKSMLSKQEYMWALTVLLQYISVPDCCNRVSAVSQSYCEKLSKKQRNNRNNALQVFLM